MRTIASLVLIAAALDGAAVIDRIAVIEGKHAIKLSDIDRELRVTEFLNREPLDLSAAARKKAAEHLIDQSIIRDEISTQGYSRATDAQAEAMLDQIRRNRYAGSDAQLRAALTRYGLTEDELRAALLWQMTVLKFIDERFRAGVLVTDDDVRKYYDEHLAELKRQHPQNFSYEALAAQIRDLLAGEQVNQQFESWLDQVRKNRRIEYVDGAFE